MTVAKTNNNVIILRPILAGSRSKQYDESIVAARLQALSLLLAMKRTGLFKGVYSATVFHFSEIGSMTECGR